MTISFLESFNHDLLNAFQLGLGLGVLVLSTLILFPGRTERNDPAQPIDPTHPAETPKDILDSPEVVLKESSSWSPHRRLNTVVYVILLATAGVIWFTSYAEDDTTTVLGSIMKAYFPREANVLAGSVKN